MKEVEKMNFVGSFESLRLRLGAKPRSSDDAQLEVSTWLRSDINLISPLADWLMDLIGGCIREKPDSVALALREALNNAVLHGNRADARKLVKVRCCCERGQGISIVVRDQGQGFDPDSIPDPVSVENLYAGHGRGVFLMKSVMDDVSFERQGAEVHMWKRVGAEPVPSLVSAKT